MIIASPVFGPELSLAAVWEGVEVCPTVTFLAAMTAAR